MTKFIFNIDEYDRKNLMLQQLTLMYEYHQNQLISVIFTQ